ncbi:MAG: response regulator [Candidatus Levybacteria bacterium]|nr:response regulator [Candidatus Levybacteria bacterium]
MRKLLIIEDDLTLADIYRQKFSGIYETDVVVDGVLGLTKAMDWRPDLVILDIMILGDMDGMKVLGELKNNTITRDIPVIVITNLEDRGEEARSLGANEYLVKSNTKLEQIAQKVGEYLGFEPTG